MAVLNDIMDALGRIFPWELAVDGDNSGLQVGSLEAEIGKVFCALDVTASSVDAAKASGSDLLVTHHPLFAKEISRLDTASHSGSMARAIFEAGLNVVACHTNADCAAGGTANLMADRLEMVEVEPIEPSTGAFLAKIAVFVPSGALEEVSSAMAGAGAGVIGNYTHCSFRTEGVGTFVPGEGASPYSGDIGELNFEEEVRLEMIAPSFLVSGVVNAVKSMHPYEEVAYDVYRTEIPVPWGLGRIGLLRKERTVEEIRTELDKWCGSKDSRVFGNQGKKTKKVAVVPGSANSLVESAIRAGADLLVAGEVNYHMLLEASEAGMALICLGHAESERAIIPKMVEELRIVSERSSWGLDIDSLM